MKKGLLNYSRLVSLLFFLIFINSCTTKNKKSNSRENTPRDSLLISIKLPPKRSAGLNFINNMQVSDYLRFVNSGNHDSVISHKLPLHYNKQVICYSGLISTNSNLKHYYHNYLIDKNTPALEFTYHKGDIILNKNKNIIVDELYKNYQKFNSIIKKANKKDKAIIKNQLDSLHLSYKNLYRDNLDFLKLNKLLYLEKTQILNPLHHSVNHYIENHLNDSIMCDIYGYIIYRYIYNRISTFNFNKLNIRNYSADYINVLSKGMYNFIISENNSKNIHLKQAKEWIKTTDFYKKNKTFIENSIEPIDKNIFKNLLADLKLLNHESECFSFSEIIKQNPAEYYLIDIWATYCKPCIKGINTINKLQIPQNISVLNICVDKSNNIEKWRKKSFELKIAKSYIISTKNTSNYDFFKFIKLKSVPRYILIDKNMNLINETFIPPHHPKFINKLKALYH